MESLPTGGNKILGYWLMKAEITSASVEELQKRYVDLNARIQSRAQDIFILQTMQEEETRVRDELRIKLALRMEGSQKE